MKIVLLGISLGLVIAAQTVLAQIDFEKIKNTFPQSQLGFAKGTVGSVIVGASDHIYKLGGIKKGQTINLLMNSGGMRAAIYLISPSGNEIGFIRDGESDRSLIHDANENGSYYLVCFSGSTHHTYDFTVRVD
ncbi:MAG: hypothetical protein SFT81_02860 [Candidatus Caenarcaniphilales bacterium]|nr:hypothetical protein [Candidatus Caenarcaniphilales bacterium]